MQNMNDLIRDMPSIPAKERGSGAMDVMLARSIIQNVLDFLRKELPSMELSVQSKDAIGLQRDVMSLTRSLESLSKTLSEKDAAIGGVWSQLQEEVTNLSLSIKSLKMPDMPSFPSEMSVKLSPEDIGMIKTEVNVPAMPSEMSVSNLGQIVDAVDALGDMIRGIQMSDTVKVSNLKDIKLQAPELKLPKKVVDALSKLSLLGRSPAEYITVRLADEDGFYRAMGESMGTAVAMTPSPGDAVRKNGASFTLAMDGTVKRITATATSIHRLEITGSVPFVWGYDSDIVHTAGSQRGCQYLPNGLAQVINVTDLSSVYFRGASGVVCGNYLY